MSHAGRFCRLLVMAAMVSATLWAVLFITLTPGCSRDLVRWKGVAEVACWVLPGVVVVSAWGASKPPEVGN